MRGLSVRVNLLSFTTDEKFVIACGEDCLTYVWELASGDVVFGNRHNAPPTVLKVLGHRTENRRVVYDITLGISTNLNSGVLYMDPQRMQWSLKLHAYTFPPGGLLRYYNCCNTSPDQRYLFVGTNGADMLVLRQDTGMFRAVIPICSNGVQSIITLPNGDLITGGGDGSIKRLRGEDMDWEIIDEVNYITIKLIVRLLSAAQYVQ